MGLNVYIGWTGEGALAYEVCKKSLISHASILVNVYPLRHWELRSLRLYHRPYMVTAEGQRIDAVDGTPFSTDFSFTRFLVPALEDYADRWALYCDSDMLWLDDVAKLLAEASGAVSVVKHNWRDGDNAKMHGQKQVNYPCKNWSSLMMMNGHRCRYLTPLIVDTSTGAFLHQFHWMDYIEDVGSLNPRWNVLHGDPAPSNPAVIHFTRGTPDMPIHAPADEWSERWWNVARELGA